MELRSTPRHLFEKRWTKNVLSSRFLPSEQRPLFRPAQKIAVSEADSDFSCPVRPRTKKRGFASAKWEFFKLPSGSCRVSCAMRNLTRADRGFSRPVWSQTKIPERPSAEGFSCPVARVSRMRNSTELAAHSAANSWTLDYFSTLENTSCDDSENLRPASRV